MEQQQPDKLLVQDEINVKYGIFIKNPKCCICNVSLTHEWLDGDYTLLLCGNKECLKELHKK